MIGNACSLARTLHKNKIVVAGPYFVLAIVKTTVVKEELLLLGYLLILLPSCAYVLEVQYLMYSMHTGQAIAWSERLPKAFLVQKDFLVLPIYHTSSYRNDFFSHPYVLLASYLMHLRSGW